MDDNTEGVEFGSPNTKCELLLGVHLRVYAKWSATPYRLGRLDTPNYNLSLSQSSHRIFKPFYTKNALIPKELLFAGQSAK